MQNLDPAGEWLRLCEHYRQLSDGELVSLARQSSELTDSAQQVLAQEIARRKLKIPPQESATPPRPLPRASVTEEEESAYDEDRELVVLCTVWSLADALKLQRLLDTAGIPFYIGPEKATGVDAVTSNFASGVDVQIMKVGVPWARQALQQYFPADVPPEQRAAESDNSAIHCPKCHSIEVVFQELDGESGNAEGTPRTKFNWTCEQCGHEWEDDGMATEN